MKERQPFDATRASFMLLAFVIGIHALVVLAGVVVCFIGNEEVIAGKFTCDQHDKLRDLLTEAMAAALAFLGYSRSDRSPPPPPPPQRE
jgi:hypothetical protein